jgi:hypothetical protein
MSQHKCVGFALFVGVGHFAMQRVLWLNSDLHAGIGCL